VKDPVAVADPEIGTPSGALDDVVVDLVAFLLGDERSYIG